MGIVDYMEEGDVANLQGAKDAFVDYIVSLEERLDKSYEYGKAADPRMLEILSELDNVEEELAYFARRANEPTPMRNYHSEIGKLVRAYLPDILSAEIRMVEDSLAENPDDADAAARRLNQLSHMIGTYGELYPEIPLGPIVGKIRTIEAGFSETTA